MGDPGELTGAHPELLSAGFRAALQQATADKKLTARDFATLTEAAKSPQDHAYLHAITSKAMQTADNTEFTIPVKTKPGGPPEAVTVDFSSDVTDTAAETLVLDYQYSGRSPAEVARLIKALVTGYTNAREEKAIAGLLNDHIPQLTEVVRALRRDGLTLLDVANEVDVTIDGPRIFLWPIALGADRDTIADAILEHLKGSVPADRQAFYDALDPKSLAWLRKRAKSELP